MKFLTNIYNPKNVDAKWLVSRLYDEDPQDAWERQERYLSDKTIGDPQPTEKYTKEQLKEMGIVGVYVEE